MVAALPIVVVMLVPVMVVTAFPFMMVLMIVIVAMAFLTIVVMMMLMFVVMTSALAVLSMFVVVLVIMIVIVASAGAALAVLMVMVVLMGGAVLMDVHHYTGILERMERPVLQLVVIHVENGGHEAEFDGLAGPYLPMEEYAFIHVRKVHGQGLLAVADGHLDMSHQCAGFPLDPSADLHEHVGQSRLHIGVESSDLSVEADGFASRLLGGVELTH